MPIPTSVLSDFQLKDVVRSQFFPSESNGDGKVGLELEVLPLRESAHSPNELVPFYNDEGTGLIQLLQTLSETNPELTFTPAADGTPKFLFGDGASLTFEPGGQLEYSSSPAPSLTEAVQTIVEVIESLRCQLKAHNIWFFHSGLNPWYTVPEVGLQLQKERYIHMNRFFETIGPYGQKMMRLSTSLQVNLDVGDPDTAQRRWLAANLLSPVFSATFANSPFVERKATGMYSFRSYIWQNLDKTRTGFQADFLAEPYKPCPVNQYLDFALNARCMRLPTKDGKLAFPGEFRSFRQWKDHGYNGYYPSPEDWEYHLTTLFPEVRPKGFFEFRFLDAQSKVWLPIPGILLTRLIYNKEACERVIELLQPYRRDLNAMWEQAAIKALDDDTLAGLAKKIFTWSMELPQENECDSMLELCERFYKTYTYRNLTPAHALLSLRQGDIFSSSDYRAFEKRQVEEAGDLLQTICDYS